MISNGMSKTRVLVALLTLAMGVGPVASTGVMATSSMTNSCRVVNFSTEPLAQAQKAVIACADWLMKTEFRRTPNLQCVPFAERLWKSITPPERSVKGKFKFVDCAGRRFTEIKNQGKPVFGQPPAGEVGLPYLVWWSDPQVASGCGHVAVYIGGGKFLDNQYLSGNRGKPWNLSGTWPRRGVRPSGYTTTGYWNS
jgi:hypothetical protein